ncbi:MAG: ECF-type sigma factor [Planctomycetaceae bacterium]
MDFPGLTEPPEPEPVSGAGPDAPAKLFTLAYDELKRLAVAQMNRERKDHTLTPTALLHEAYLRVCRTGEVFASMSRVQFFAFAAESMRRILVEHARKHVRRREIISEESAGQTLITIPDSNETIDLLLLDEALNEFAGLQPGKSDLVKLKFFGGLTIEEIAVIQNISVPTANRHWAFAKAWLTRRMNHSADTPAK